MKEIFKKLFLIFTIPLILFLIIYSRLAYLDYYAKQKHSRQQIGIYKIDLFRTKKANNINDTLLFEDLMVVFNEDKTFKFNKKAPFLFDDIGTWEASGNGFEDWGWITYDKKQNSKSIKNPFCTCCNPDSTFYINDVTPEQGNKQLSIIYFKKLNPNIEDFTY
jgi:hypothetical protein